MVIFRVFGRLFLSSMHGTENKYRRKTQQVFALILFCLYQCIFKINTVQLFGCFYCRVINVNLNVILVQFSVYFIFEPSGKVRFRIRAVFLNVDPCRSDSKQCSAVACFDRFPASSTSSGSGAKSESDRVDHFRLQSRLLSRLWLLHFSQKYATI